MGHRERDVVDAESCESDENFWSERSGEDSENRRSVDLNAEKSAGSGNGRAPAEDDDGALNLEKSVGLSDGRATAEDGDGASEGDFIGRRRSTSPTASPPGEHHRLQVKRSLHTGLGEQRLLQVQSHVNTMDVESSIHRLR